MADPMEKPVKDIIVHRSTILRDLIKEFGEEDALKFNFNIRVIGNNGEKGEGNGVLREVLSIFWQNVFTSLALGAKEKVPCIRHDFQKKGWEAVARLLVYGYTSTTYLPPSLSVAFIALCIFGEEQMSNDFLVKSFKLFVSEDEKVAIDICLNGGPEFDNSNDDILEFLSSYKCFQNPTKENIKAIIFELAHQEIIQKPRYIANCWAPIVKGLQVFKPFQSIDDLENIFNEKKVTNKKLVKLLSGSPVTDAERESFEHLKRFIKNLKEDGLSAFLQFTTGSNCITCEHIEVTFTSLDGFARRPIAHTCTPLLELPTTYKSFNELSEEFTSILRETSSWEFNIV